MEVRESKAEVIKDSTVKLERVTELITFCQELDTKLIKGFKNVDSRLLQYAKIPDLKLLEASLVNYAPANALVQLESRVKPLLSQAEILLDQYRDENHQMKACVLKFDETLSLKADKWAIEEIKKEIADKYMTTNTFEKSIQNIKETSQKITRDLAEQKQLQAQQETMMQQIVQKIVAKQM